jgi:ABC-type multidrug transport system fused ATPase/permease subunit
MKTKSKTLDIAGAFDAASKTAAEREAQAGELLWGQVTMRAANDEGFREQLAKKPEETLKREAERLQIPVSKEDLDTAKQLFGSPALPGIDHVKVENLIFGTIEDVRRSFNMTLSLARALFIVGLLMLVASAVLTIWKGAQAGSIFGIGGVASLVSSLLLNPLDRIRNAGANLVQIQMAYLAYYNLMYLLGSRNERLNVADSKAYAEELREAATSMVSAVQEIVEKSAPGRWEGKGGRGKGGKGKGSGMEKAKEPAGNGAAA